MVALLIIQLEVVTKLNSQICIVCSSFFFFQPIRRSPKYAYLNVNLIQVSLFNSCLTL